MDAKYKCAQILLKLREDFKNKKDERYGIFNMLGCVFLVSQGVKFKK